MKRLLSFAAACAVLLQGAPSLAATMQAEFRGTVVQGFDDNGFFGGGASLDGLDFTALYLFDPTQGVLTVTPDSVDLLGGVEFGVAPSPILSASLTINGHTAAFSTDQFNGEVLYDAGGGVIKFAAGEDSAVDNELDLYMFNPATPLGLGQVFEVHGASPPGLFNYDACCSDADPHFHGVLEATSLKVTSTAAVVPEPVTWALLTTGFFGLGCALRWRRRGTAGQGG
jgi:hypothetical protein